MNVGDVVRLKSGGPNMTIQELGGHPELSRARCCWFTKDQAWFEQWFETACVEVVDLKAAKKVP